MKIACMTFSAGWMWELVATVETTSDEGALEWVNQQVADWYTKGKDIANDPGNAGVFTVDGHPDGVAPKVEHLGYGAQFEANGGEEYIVIGIEAENQARLYHAYRITVDPEYAEDHSPDC